MSQRFDELLQRYPALHECSGSILSAFELLKEAFLNTGKLLLCGNGGSASDADHWSGELLKGFFHPRPLSQRARKGIPPEIADRLQWALPAIPLTAFPALTTAFGNDVDPELVFAQLVFGLGHENDVLVAISTSGNSANVCHAAKVARAKGLKVLGLTGAKGGNLRELSDVCICAPALITPAIQEFHLPIYHCLCLMLEDHFVGAWKE